jgi:predicted MFS family arabinose efflux permease
VLAGPLTRRWGAKKAFALGTGLSALSLLATAAASSSLALFGLRVIVGVSGAVSFIAGAALVAQVSPPGSVRRAAALLGVYTAGIGAGIVISGAGVPWLLAAVASPNGWRVGWLLFGGLATLASVIAVPAALSREERTVSPGPAGRWPSARLAPLLACYVLFGAGYIGYFTFIVAYLQGRGASPAFITAFWIVLGAAGIVGGFGWAPVIGRLRAGRGPSVMMAVVCIGTLPPLLSRSLIAAIASAALFGSSVVATVASVMAVARRSLEPAHWAEAITWLTVGFAAGQCLGPVLAGLLADRPAGLEAGLYLSAGILAIGSAVALIQPHINAHLASDVAAARTLAEADIKGAGL